MKILLTGSHGFLGSHYLEMLHRYGHDVIPVDIRNGLDLCDRDLVQSLPDVETVVHFAALNGTKHFYDRPWTVITNNILPTQYLLERYANQVELFVFAGSCESYASSVSLGVAEIPTAELVPLCVDDVTNPRWSYGGSKIANELQVLAAHHQFDMSYQILRFHNVYGPGQVDHFIPEFVERSRQGDYRVFGGDETRAFCFVSDALDAAHQLMLDHDCHDHIINIGHDHEITIAEVARKILQRMGINHDINSVPGRPGSVQRRCPDVTLLRSLTGWCPRVDIDHGLDLTLGSL